MANGGGVKFWRPSKEPGYLSQMMDCAKAAGTFKRETLPAEKRKHRERSQRNAKLTKGERQIVRRVG